MSEQQTSSPPLCKVLIYFVPENSIEFLSGEASSDSPVRVEFAVVNVGLSVENVVGFEEAIDTIAAKESETPPEGLERMLRFVEAIASRAASSMAESNPVFKTYYPVRFVITGGIYDGFSSTLQGVTIPSEFIEKYEPAEDNIPAPSYLRPQ